MHSSSEFDAHVIAYKGGLAAGDDESLQGQFTLAMSALPLLLFGLAIGPEARRRPAARRSRRA